MVWLGGKSLRNFETALKRGVWGFEEPRPALETLRPGDVVVFGEGYSGGQPRVGLAEWQQGSLRRLVLGSITRGMYRDTEPVWPDDVYEFRFDFARVGDAPGVALAPDSIPQVIADALRPVGTSTGRLVQLDDDQLAQLHQLVDAAPADVAVPAQPAVDPSSGPDAAEEGPSVWWVNQGTSYGRERDGGYVWAPKTTKAGTPVAHHTNVELLKPNDVIVHYRDSHIRAVSRVCSHPVDATNPTFSPDSPWGKDGTRTRVDYFELDSPISLDQIALEHRVGETSGPFAAAGAVKQGYLFPLSISFSDYLRSSFQTAWPAASPWGTHPAQYWLFQANPKYWSLEEFLASAKPGTTDTWTATTHHADMAADDRVVLWQAGPRAGIYALSRLIGEPQWEETPDYLPQDKTHQWRVPIQLTTILNAPILRSDLLTHPVLKDLQVIKFANATNFKMTPEQWGAILDAIGEADAPTPQALPAKPLAPVAALTPDAVQPFLAERGLLLDESIVATAVAALRAGKHLVLTGAPGTGKTELALALADAARSLGISNGTAPHTATADWTSVETVGGYRVLADGGLAFRAGLVLEAIDGNQWLVLDEFNRADIDKAIGQLFTVLSGQAVTLPFVEVRDGLEMAPSIVPPDALTPPSTHGHLVSDRWRILATLNTRDRDLLFSMSYALLRRFAVVDVPAPPPVTIAEIVATKSPSGDVDLDASLVALASLPHRPMSPAILIDCGRYLSERRSLEPGANTSAILKEALFAFVLPQLDDLSVPQLRDVVRYLHLKILKLPTVRDVAAVLAEALLLDTNDLVPKAPASGEDDPFEQLTDNSAAADPTEALETDAGALEPS